MWMELTSPCPVVATSASLCEKRKGTCLTIPEATVQEDESHYTIDDVDKNPNLCFKVRQTPSTHIAMWVTLHVWCKEGN
ncbi:hypothetical protein FKM82_004496 [Ascaphus truei]